MSKLSSALRAKVQSGDAHWVTIKEGPLEGRHLLFEDILQKNGLSKSIIWSGLEEKIPPDVLAYQGRLLIKRR